MQYSKSIELYIILDSLAQNNFILEKFILTFKSWQIWAQFETVVKSLLKIKLGQEK